MGRGMSTQRDRFEAAWKAGGDYAIWTLERNERTGKYFSIKAQAAFEGFQLGEASGFERAAKVCDDNAESWSDPYESEPACGVRKCAEQIRALAVGECKLKKGKQEKTK